MREGPCKILPLQANRIPAFHLHTGGRTRQTKTAMNNHRDCIHGALPASFNTWIKASGMLCQQRQLVRARNPALGRKIPVLSDHHSIPDYTTTVKLAKWNFNQASRVTLTHTHTHTHTHLPPLEPSATTLATRHGMYQVVARKLLVPPWISRNRHWTLITPMPFSKDVVCYVVLEVWFRSFSL